MLVPRMIDDALRLTVDKLFEKAQEEFDETEASFKEYREKYSEKIIE